MTKRALTAALCAVTIAALGTAPAYAGEITGNGKWIAGSEEAPLHGKSECAYSGRNDENVLYAPDHPLYQPERAQSWGQIPKEDRDFFTMIGAHPSEACNPSN